MRSIHRFQIVTVLLPLLLVGIVMFYHSETAGNPIPLGTPYILMTTEEMSISISDEYTVAMKGVYTFDLVYFPLPENPDGPPWDFIMYFPAPPDAKMINITKNKTDALAWRWTEEEYVTTVDDLIESPPPELRDWTMFAWDVSLDTGQVKITVQYEHELVQLSDDRWALLYSLGTGRYAEGWYPPIPGLPNGKPYVNVTIDVVYPSTLQTLVCTPTGEYNPTITLLPALSWKAYEIIPMNDFVALFCEECSRGDIDGNGRINILDVVRAVNIILSVGDPPTDLEIWEADCNGDGVVDVTDIVGIVRVILMVGSCPP